jgi:hypothetical protein
MKQRMKNEIVRGRADLDLTRRMGHGFWFQVRSATLARERKEMRLCRALRAQELSFARTPLSLAPTTTESVAL